MNDWGEVCRHAIQIGAGLWLQSFMLFFAGLVAGWLMRKRGPLFEAAAYKASLCAVMLGAILGITLAGHVRPMWLIALPATQSAPLVAPFPSVHAAHINTQGPVWTTARLTQQTAVDESHARVISGQAYGLSWSSVYAVLAAAWLVVTLAQIAWFLPGAIALARIRKMPPLDEGERASMLLGELSRQAGITVPRLIVHEEIRSPFVAGIVQPMIVLPSALLGLDESVLRAVLSHELGHVISNDSAWAPLFRIVMALAWPQPLLRVLYLRWLSASEYACDTRALSNGCSPMDYAECLVRLSEERQSPRAVRAFAVGITPFRSLLGRRVQQILCWGDGELHSLSFNARYALGCAAVLAGIAAVFLVPGSVGAHATARQFSNLTLPPVPSPPAAPARQFAWLNHDATVKKGGLMNRKASRMLSTSAAIAGGLAHGNLPSAAPPVAALPSVHFSQLAPRTTSTDSAVQVTKTAAGNLLVSINCNKAPIHAIIEKMFQAAGVGYSMPGQVSGNVTLQVHSLPIDAVLRVLLRSSDQPLTFEVADNVYCIKLEAKLPIAPQGSTAPTSENGESSDNAADDSTSLHWYKVVLLNTKSEDVAGELKQHGITTSGVLPSDVTILALKEDNSVLIKATPDEFTKLRDKIRDLEGPVH